MASLLWSSALLAKFGLWEVGYSELEAHDWPDDWHLCCIYVQHRDSILRGRVDQQPQFKVELATWPLSATHLCMGIVGDTSGVSSWCGSLSLYSGCLLPAVLDLVIGFDSVVLCLWCAVYRAKCYGTGPIPILFV